MMEEIVMIKSSDLENTPQTKQKVYLNGKEVTDEELKILQERYGKNLKVKSENNQGKDYTVVLKGS